MIQNNLYGTANSTVQKKIPVQGSLDCFSLKKSPNNDQSIGSDTQISDGSDTQISENSQYEPIKRKRKYSGCYDNIDDAIDDRDSRENVKKRYSDNADNSPCFKKKKNSETIEIE